MYGYDDGVYVVLFQVSCSLIEILLPVVFCVVRLLLLTSSSYTVCFGRVVTCNSKIPSKGVD